MLSFFRRQSPRRDDLLRNHGFVLAPSSKDGLGSKSFGSFLLCGFPGSAHAGQVLDFRLFETRIQKPFSVIHGASDFP